ncbi:MAG: hypothetical protein DMF69_11725 [Acidobacteria bacterium]|nr:MAG: hypothetical protein DMF69_11725 [Acidobacteriota bacterium]
MSATNLRRAELSDVPEITSLINAAFKIAEEFFVDGNRISIEGVLEHFESGEFLLAEEEGKLVGCVYLEQRGDHTYLGLLSADPTIQRAGLGSRILTGAEEYCRKRGAKFMDISVVSLREELLPFYAKRGYVETGTSPFPSDVKLKLPCHFINMSKDLVDT